MTLRPPPSTPDQSRGDAARRALRRRFVSRQIFRGVVHAQVACGIERRRLRERIRYASAGTRDGGERSSAARARWGARSQARPGPLASGARTPPTEARSQNRPAELPPCRPVRGRWARTPPRQRRCLMSSAAMEVRTSTPEMPAAGYAAPMTSVGEVRSGSDALEPDTNVARPGRQNQRDPRPDAVR